MSLPLTFAWCFIALIAGLFIASVYYDARQRKLLQQLDAALQACLPQSLPEIAAWRAEHGFDAA